MSLFSPEFLEFLRQLKRHNDRDWFTANKERYLTDVQAPALEFVADAETGLRNISTELVADPRPSGGSMFRIHRDTRFSKDKSPYKTAVGIRFPHRSTRDMHTPGLYLNLEPGNAFVAAGIRQLDTTTATTIRDEIIQRPAAWKKAVHTPPFSPGFELSGDTLTRPPRGVDPEHALIDDLKRKDFIGVQPARRGHGAVGRLRPHVPADKPARSTAAALPLRRARTAHLNLIEAPEHPTRRTTMPSKESAAVKELWASFTAAAASNPDQTPQEISDRVERHWGGLTAEPGRTDYLEIEVAGLPALWAVPHASPHDRVILSLHGGGFVSGSPYTHRKLYAHLANAVGARVLLTDYRRSPAHPHPAPLEDTTAAYQWLLDQGIAARHIAIAGDSSGGGLAVSTMLRARDLGLPMAAALLLISPWVDMTVSAETFISNRERDAFFFKEVVDALAGMFLAGADPKDPFASPLHADLTGLPPLNIQVGGDETLLGESQALADKARLADLDVRLDVFPDQQHSFQMAAGRAPESSAAIAQLAEWVRPHLGL